ncbi:DUF5686 family protein [uncultured Lacinutrix sp.]|uniref:DUF5686 family protein n=1 Tax=uncultured Lacinutrix sp. TaxID=574032 RepID=UPI00262286BD|nr:DUF5686 family protein [uncultured Lacinutrix sp.]
MCNRTNRLILLFFIIVYNSFSQTNTKLSIVDLKTKEPIAFANIIFDNNSKTGTISDIDGVFKVNKKQIETITISYIGYTPKTVSLSSLNNNIITLTPKLNKLEEVVLNSAENPANRIIRNVIKNKDLNNPLKINSFSYKSYSKVVFDSANKLTKDSLGSVFKDKNLFITETISKRKYLKPNFSEDEVIATKTSGFKHPNFAFLPTTFQPFSFYENNILLYDINYLNPISKGSLKKYNFVLEEEIVRENDTVFIISFKPKKNKNIEGLKGLLYINSNKYAVQNVEATPFNKTKVSIKIQQKYAYVNNKYWFPEQLNFEITVGTDANISINYTGKSYLSDIKTGIPLKPIDFSFETLTFLKDATNKDDDFWNKNRVEVLNKKELSTYKFLDSIGEKYNLDRKLKIMESLISGKYRFKYVDLDLTKLVQANKYEGTRLGTGFYTNDDILKHVSIGGFAGYGFKDEAWKYGAEIKAKIPSKKDISFSFKYENELREVGSNPISKKWKPLSYRGFQAEKFDQTKSFSFETKLKLIRNFYWNLKLSTTNTTPKYDYQFNNDNTLITAYKNSEFNLNLKYYFREALINSFGNKIRVDNGAPVLSFTYSKGIKNLFDSDFNYNAYRFSLDHRFESKNIGITSYRLEAGYIDTSLPYGLLFTGEGSQGSGSFIIAKNTFQTLQPYEFLSDASINLFTRHNFGGLLIKSGTFQPDLIMHNNLGYGSLKDSFKHENIGFNTKNKVFLETGLELRNIYRMNYMNIGSIGLGVGAFYRYGDYKLPNANDNFEFKFSLGFSSK